MSYPRFFLGTTKEKEALSFLKIKNQWFYVKLPSKKITPISSPGIKKFSFIDSFDYLIQSYLSLLGRPVYLYLTPDCRWLWPYLLTCYTEIPFSFYYKPFRKFVPYIAIGELTGLKSLTQSSPKPFAYFSLDF